MYSLVSQILFIYS